MMFKHLATTLNRLVAYLFTAPSVQMEIRLSDTASNSPVKSGQPCKDAQIPVAQKPKRKPKAVQQTKQASSRKQTQKPVQTISGKDGLQPAIPASKTRQPAKPAPTKKPKAAASTTQAKKRTAKQTPAQTRTARPSKARGS